jgi:tRNA nucleotidyltransferase/poly(A) polymerase
MIVGGFVRDCLLDVSSKDIDIEVHALRPAAVESALRSLGPVDTVGRAFGVFKLRFDGLDLDISLPRSDSKTGDKHNDFAVVVDPFLGEAAAAARRDFTINAIMLDAVEGHLVDPFRGVQDLEKGVLRAVGPAFSEDPLRVLRAVQFAARFGFRIEAETAATCRTLSLEGISIERVWSEWDKIGRKGVDWGALSAALEAVGLSTAFGLIRPLAGDLTGLSGDERSAFVFAGLGVSLNAIDCPLAIRRQVEALRFAIRHFDMRERPFSQADARLILPVTLRDLARFSRTRDAKVAAPELLDGPPAPLLTGADLIARGLKPGPEFGRILKAALDSQDAGDFTDKEGALAWLDASGL